MLQLNDNCGTPIIV